MRCVLVQPTRPDQSRKGVLEAPCPRCPTGTITHVLALARSMGSPGFDIFQCNRCGLIEWIEAYGMGAAVNTSVKPPTGGGLSHSASRATRLER